MSQPSLKSILISSKRRGAVAPGIARFAGVLCLGVLACSGMQRDDSDPRDGPHSGLQDGQSDDLGAGAGTDEGAKTEADEGAAAGAVGLGDGGCVADLEGATLELWPPNHKFHTVSVHDCVEVDPDCADEVALMFTQASSDEPEDDKGDGHHAPDILVDDCETVRLRSERAGPRNSRFYTLHWLARDEGGNENRGTCQVIVPHDKGPHEPIDDGPAYTIDIGEDFEDCDDGDGGDGDVGDGDGDVGDGDGGDGDAGDGDGGDGDGNTPAE
ncbi:MAG: hypothetical protein V3V08_24830 [Nannocystaceae bacterium]